MVNIVPTYPVSGDNNVNPWSHFIIDIESSTEIDPDTIDVYLGIGDAVDDVYPVSPDYYGIDLDTNTLLEVDAPLDGDLYRLMYVEEGIPILESVCGPLSTLTPISLSKYRIYLYFNQPLGYGVTHSLRIRAEGVSQLVSFTVAPRRFYSPAIGDVRSAWEAFVEDTDISATLPETSKLRDYALAQFDTRHERLALRRLFELGIQSNIGFSDTYSVSKAIQVGARTIAFHPPYKPRSIKDIDNGMGVMGLEQLRRAIRELETKKTIPKAWVQSVSSVVDFLRIDMTHRVRAVAQTVIVGYRAVKDGYL